ncbi:MAG: DUF1499 domain-containing protein [Pseudomonadota bacterium]
MKDNRKTQSSRRAALPWLLGLPALAAAAIAVIGPRKLWEKTVGSDAGDLDFSADNLGELLGEKPNVGLAAPNGFFGPGLAGRVNHIVPDYQASADDLFVAVKAAALSLPNVQLIEQNFASSSLRFVRFSPTMGFPDTINIVLTERPEGTSFVAAARARVGYSDLGMNAKLLRELINAVDQQIRAASPAS